MMNKKEFINELSKQIGYDKEKCEKINNILENTFLIGKKNKEKIITEFTKELKIDENEANKIYESVMQVISKEIKNKIKHPFKSQD